MKNNKIVLIAGGDGGVGFNCVKLFLNSGYKVVVIDKSCENKNFYLKNNINFFKSTLNSEKKINYILLKIQKKNWYDKCFD